VVVLDDLHWADKASLALLRHLGAADTSMRVLVVGTYRDNELAHAHALVDALAALRRQSGVSWIELAGLDDTGVLAFLEAAAGQTLDDAGVGLAHAVYRETDGNPFFVSEVLRHLAETGAIFQDDTGRWTTDASLEQMGLPDSVRQVIGARVLRLGTDAGRVLSTAAVIGRDFDLDLLAKATSTSEDDLLDILDAATAAALVRELADTPGRYNFAHALIQHTLYEDLGPTRRARAHRQIGEALEQLCGDRPGTRVGELARHWTSATQPAEANKAIAYSRQAGDAALAALAPADALGYYAQALDLYPNATDPDPVLALDLAIGLGTAQRLTGDPAYRETLLDATHRAADLDDTTRLVAAALANNAGMTTAAGFVDAEKVQALELARDRLTPAEPDRALVLATLCSELAYRTTVERRLTLADEAVAIAESAGDETTIVRVLNLIHIPLLVPSMLEQTLARTSDAMERAERLGDPVQLFWAANWRTDAAVRAGDIDEVDHCLESARLLAEQLAQPTLTWTHTYMRCMRALVAGDTEQAEELATEALRIGTECGQPSTATTFEGQFMQVSTQRGTLGELVPAIETAVAANPGLPVFRAVLAAAHAEADHTDDAMRLLEEFTTADDLPQDQVWTTGMICYATAAIQCKDPSYAEPLLHRLVPHADQVACSLATANGPISHYLGGLAAVLGRYDDADSYFAKAETINERMGDKFYAAGNDFLWGQMLTERNGPGDLDRACELLQRAQSVAAANGYANIERRATEALQRLG